MTPNTSPTIQPAARRAPPIGYRTPSAQRPPQTQPTARDAMLTLPGGIPASQTDTQYRAVEGPKNAGDMTRYLNEYQGTLGNVWDMAESKFFRPPTTGQQRQITPITAEQAKLQQPQSTIAPTTPPVPGQPIPLPKLDLAGDIQSQVSSFLRTTNPIPEAPSMVDEFGKLRADMGIADLEGQIGELKNQEREAQANLRARSQYQKGQQQSLGVIGGRLNEVQMQERENLEFIQRESAFVNDRLNTAYNYVNMVMSFTDKDYQNAMKQYETEFNQKMNTYNAIYGAMKDQKEFAYKDQDIARANLEIFTNQINQGALSYANLDESTRSQIAKLETQAGLPIGFTANLKMKPGANIVSSTSRTDASGNKYVDMIVANPDGSLSTESKFVGSEYVARSGGGSSSSSTAAMSQIEGVKQADFEKYVANASDQLIKFENNSNEAIWGSDAKGDLKLADWEIKQFTDSMISQYGPEVGMKVASIAFQQSGIQVWEE